MFGQNFNKPKWMLVIAFLMQVTGQLSANAQQLINSGKVNPRDSTLAVRQSVVAGGVVNILDGYSTQVKGRNDFNGNRLTNGRNFVWDAITVNYGVAADGTAVEAVDYTTALPAALKSANLIVRQDDDVIRKISLSAINDAKNTDARWYELGGFGLLKEELVTAIEIEFASGTDLAPGAGNTAYVEVLLKGFETAIKR